MLRDPGERVATEAVPEPSAFDLPGENRPVIPLVELERQAIEHALRVSGGSVQLAATQLGTSSATLYRRIKDFRIVVPRKAETD
jgi:transcriptional regulator of acetoin/glycerol metabolism